jgi:SAM-dependent methyltransferase
VTDNSVFYEAFAANYEAHYRTVDAPAAVQQWLARMEALKLVPLEPARRARRPTLLDLGCGPGWHLREWATSGFSAAGMDVSPTMLRLARRNWEGAADDAIPQLFCADIREPKQIKRLRAAYQVVVAHFNFLNLFTPVELRTVFASISTLLKFGGLLFTDLALPAAVENAPTESNNYVRQRERRWHLSDGEFVETYWFHSLNSVKQTAADHRLAVADAAAWLPRTASHHFASLAEDTPKAWLALRKS